jgi:RNA polymerase sigma-70 factor (ECF subfamily)
MPPMRTRRRSERAGQMADEPSVRAAYLAHGPELYRFACRQLGDPAAAQDVVQEAFVRAWRSSSRFDPEIASLRTWLFSITRNVIIDAARRNAVRPWQRPADDGTVNGSPARGAMAPFDESLVDAWVVEEALGRISAEHREAIVQTHLLQRGHDEVAAELGVPVGTLRSRVFYGLKALRLAMEEMGVEP